MKKTNNMANIPPKKLTLRAFRIENPSLTEAHSHILELLQQVLTDNSKAAQRRMTLNDEEPDRDLLANFTWGQNDAFMFGMMLRIIPADNGGVMDEQLFDQPTITMAQVSEGSADQSQYKGHYYFALNNNYLVTNLAGNLNIGRLQTYINWLLQKVRGERVFQFTQLTKLPNGVKVGDIKNISFVGGGNVVTAKTTGNEQTIMAKRIKDIGDRFLEYIYGGDTEDLECIRANQLIEATLLLKFKAKKKDLAKQEYQRVMGAIVTNITNDNGIIVHTKNGNKYTGGTIKVKKSISVECVAANRIVEEQLKQEMELFLIEIRDRQNE